MLANKKTDTLNIAWDQPLDNADAYFNTSRGGILLARMVWDQLIERDPDTFEYKPGLATAWRWIDDLTLEFELRQGVQFHNGQPFDADDVVYTLNFASDPANKAVNTTSVGWIRHAAGRLLRRDRSRRYIRGSKRDYLTEAERRHSIN